MCTRPVVIINTVYWNTGIQSSCTEHFNTPQNKIRTNNFYFGEFKTYWFLKLYSVCFLVRPIYYFIFGFRLWLIISIFFFFFFFITGNILSEFKGLIYCNDTLGGASINPEQECSVDYKKKLVCKILNLFRRTKFSETIKENNWVTVNFGRLPRDFRSSA